MFYRHWTKKLIYTEGVHQLAEANGAYWLIDVIASYQGSRNLAADRRLRDFQLWELTVVGSEAVVACRADSYEDPAVRQKIEFTDYPEGGLTLYVERGQELTLMLPEER